MLGFLKREYDTFVLSKYQASSEWPMPMKKLNRREVLKVGAMASVGAAAKRCLDQGLLACSQDTPPTAWKPGDPIQYINPKIPGFELPPYRGERYEATVPDTLDIAERALLAIHALTEVTNPLADHEIYCIVYLHTNPPSMMQNCWHPTLLPKFMWALLLARLVSGSELNMHVERHWMEVALRMQGPDGLIYAPVKGRPWAYEWWQIRSLALPTDQILQPFDCGVMLSAMSRCARRDPGPVWRTSLKRLVDGLSELAVIDGDDAYFWPSCILASKNRPTHPPMSTLPFETETSVVPMGLVQAYGVLGYEPALVLAKKFINYLHKNFYRPDGSFLARPGLALKAHTHSHTRGLLAMEEYAEVTGDRELMDFVVRSFEYVRDQGANVAPGALDSDLIKTPGAGLVGFFPEWTNSPSLQTAETCQVADMVALAMRLSEASAGDYWDDADRWIRNQFAENQLLDIDWIARLGKTGPPPKTGNHISTERVAERNQGAFAGCPSPNDWYARAAQGQHAIGHCCTANGTKTLAWIHERIVRYKDGRLRVNLLLNCASRWADIDSYIPYQGRIEIRVKQAVDLSVRIPEWVTPEQTHCRVNQQERTLGWEGRYAKVGKVTAGDQVTVTFPIFERTDKVLIEKSTYTLVRKGNEVVSIAPQGINSPLYQRQFYHGNEPRMRTVTRFASSETTP